jgi:hypothetical protein
MHSVPSGISRSVAAASQTPEANAAECVLVHCPNRNRRNSFSSVEATAAAKSSACRNAPRLGLTSAQTFGSVWSACGCEGSQVWKKNVASWISPEAIFLPC